MSEVVVVTVYLTRRMDTEHKGRLKGALHLSFWIF